MQDLMKKNGESFVSQTHNTFNFDSRNLYNWPLTTKNLNSVSLLSHFESDIPKSPHAGFCGGSLPSRLSPMT